MEECWRLRIETRLKEAMSVVAVAAIGGGILGFYVMHHVEAAYEERMTEEYVKLLAEMYSMEDATLSNRSAANINVKLQQRHQSH